VLVFGEGSFRNLIPPFTIIILLCISLKHPIILPLQRVHVSGESVLIFLSHRM
jgi:hypothetical protein